MTFRLGDERVAGARTHPSLVGGSDPLAPIPEKAVALYQEVKDNYNAPNRGKTVLIANSMGGAIVRGMLAYSESVGGVAAKAVDSVFFIEGAQAGSWIAGANKVSDPYLSTVKMVISQNLPWKTGRPAAAELAPDSRWYQWANGKPVPNLPYFNAYGDITIHLKACLWLCYVDSDGPEVGDGVLLPGSPDPSSLDRLGAARFIPSGQQADHIEYKLADKVVFDVGPVDPIAGGKRAVGLVSDIWNSPVSHFQLSGQIANVSVPHCGTTQPSAGKSWSLAQEYWNLIYRRIAAKTPTCDPTDWTDWSSPTA